MKHTPSRRPELRLLAFWLAFGAALTLVSGGCKNAPRNESEPPAPTPTPRPPRLDPDADNVTRQQTENINFDYRVMLNAEPLNYKGVPVNAVEFVNSNGKADVWYPLRATGEGLGYHVAWQPRKRRVAWNQSVVPAPIMILNGRSYLSSTRFRDWLQRFDNVATVRQFRFGDLTGYVEIESKRVRAGG